MLKFGSNDDNEDSFKPGKWFTGLFNKDEPLLENTDDVEEANGKKADEQTQSGGSEEGEESSWLSGFKGIFKKEDNTPSQNSAHEELYKLDNESSSSGGSWFSNITDKFNIKSKENGENSPLIKENETNESGSNSSINKSNPDTTTEENNQEGGTAVSWLMSMRSGSGGNTDTQNQNTTTKTSNPAGLDLSLYKTNTQGGEEEESEEKKESNGWFSNIKGLVIKDARKEPEVQPEKPEQTGLNKYINNLKIQVRAIRSIIEDLLD